MTKKCEWRFVHSKVVQRTVLSGSRRELSNEYYSISIRLQHLASIQPRTSLIKFARSPCIDPPISFSFCLKQSTIALFSCVNVLFGRLPTIWLHEAFFRSASFFARRAGTWRQSAARLHRFYGRGTYVKIKCKTI